MASWREPAKNIYCSLGRLGQTCKFNIYNEFLKAGTCAHPDNLRCCNSTDLECLQRKGGKCHNSLGACWYGEPAQTLLKERQAPPPKYLKYYAEKGFTVYQVYNLMHEWSEGFYVSEKLAEEAMDKCKIEEEHDEFAIFKIEVKGCVKE